MKLKPWMNNSYILSGTTLRDPHEKENGNMALHVPGNKDNILENRKAFGKEIGKDLSDCVFACQTHSDHFYKVENKDKGKGSLHYEDGIADCDALYTTEKGIVLGVFHADCVPVLLYDPITSLVAAIHSGWQGTVKEITSKVVSHIIQTEGVDPANLQAYIGCAIEKNSLEIGMDVIEKVQAMSFDTSSYLIRKNEDKAYMDNKGLNMKMLLNAGVLAENIHIDRNDTFQENDAFFSYRRDHNCGRHMTYIMLK